MKTAIELMEMAQKINAEILAAGFTDKELMQVCELIHRANSVIAYLTPIEQKTIDRGVQ